MTEQLNEKGDFLENNIKKYQGLWQDMINYLVEEFNIDLAFITKIKNKKIKFIVLNNNISTNEIHPGKVYDLLGTYCEKTVMLEEDDFHLVTNAKKNDDGFYQKEIDNGYLSYLGFPLFRSNGEIFGTLCVAHHEPKNFNSDQICFMKTYSEMIRSNLIAAEMR